MLVESEENVVIHGPQ